MGDSGWGLKNLPLTNGLDLEPSAHVWWRHVTVLICLLVWAIEILISGENDDEFGTEMKRTWKLD